MRIGIDARFAGVHERGIGRYVFELVEGLFANGINERHEIVLFVTKKNEYLWERLPHVKKRVVSCKWYGLKEQLIFPFQLFSEHLDIMHFPHYNVPFIYRKKFIVTIHDLLLHRYPSSNASTRKPWLFYIKYLAYRLIVYNALRASKRIVCVSEFTKNEVMSLYPQLLTPISVVYEGVASLGKLEPVNRIKALAKPFVLSVGSSYPHKNLERTIETLVPYLRSRSMVYLHVGRLDFFTKRLKKWAEQRHFNDVVYFFGEATDGELATVYTKARVLLFLSRYEGFGLPALEAMAYECPVIISDKGSLPEVTGDAARIVKDADFSSLPEIINEIMEDDNLRKTMIRDGKRQIKNFSWLDMAKNIEKLYTISIK